MLLAMLAMATRAEQMPRCIPENNLPLAERSTLTQYHATFLGLPFLRAISLEATTIALPGRRILATWLKMRRVL